jgi:hypothetical protein
MAPTPLMDQSRYRVNNYEKSSMVKTKDVTKYLFNKCPLANGCPYKFAILLGQTKKRFYNFCISKNKCAIITNKPQKGPNIGYCFGYMKIFHNYFSGVKVKSFNIHHMT